MNGKRGRPKGKKDAKTRAGGRWSKATRDRLGIAAAAPRKSLASSGAGQQSLDSLLSRGADAAPEGAADDATAASGSGASPEEEFAEGDEADEMAAAARSNGDEETAEEAAEETAGGRAENRSAENRRTEQRSPVENVEVEESMGLRDADIRDGINMRFYRVVRSRLMTELSERCVRCVVCGVWCVVCAVWSVEC